LLSVGLVPAVLAGSGAPWMPTASPAPARCRRAAPSEYETSSGDAYDVLPLGYASEPDGDEETEPRRKNARMRAAPAGPLRRRGS